MISAFEKLPQERQQRMVDQAIKQMREDREKMIANGGAPQAGTNQIILSEELRQKVTTMGLKTFYSESSAQTKAELAPLLEEMQQMMQGGRMFRGGPRSEEHTSELTPRGTP